MTEETSNDKINSQKTDQEQVGIRRVEMAKGVTLADIAARSEEHTSELQSR